MTTTHPPSPPDAAAATKAPGPRIRRLHARIGAAHHQAEGMAFSRAFLDGNVTPLQLAALLRALLPAYQLIEETGPELAAALGAEALPWKALGRTAALQHDTAGLAGLGATPPSAAASFWVERLRELSRQAPHRFMAHVYVRYGGDLSGGQQLGGQADAILRRHDLPVLDFWAFEQPVSTLKEALHEGFEQLDLTDAEETELLEEAVLAFGATQRLLAELEELA